jgi:hypothetical protein
MADLTKKLIALDRLNEDMVHDDDTCSTFTGNPRKWIWYQRRKLLGPEGTELINETFRPPPGEPNVLPNVYPQRWVAHQDDIRLCPMPYDSPFPARSFST